MHEAPPDRVSEWDTLRRSGLAHWWPVRGELGVGIVHLLYVVDFDVEPAVEGISAFNSLVGHVAAWLSRGSTVSGARGRPECSWLGGAAACWSRERLGMWSAWRLGR